MYREPRRILIADDEYLVQRLLSNILEELGYSVAGTAATGREAISLTQQLKPDAVLMDIKMPDLDGLTACRELQNSSPVPVVIVSSYDAPDLLQQAGEAGAGAYLLKPPTAASLHQALTIACARHNDLCLLQQANGRLQQALAVRDLLFAVISHDLRSPLLSLNSYIEMTVDGKLDPETRARLYPVLTGQLDNLNRLLDELLEWGRSHINSPATAARPETVTPSEIAEEELQRISTEAGEKQLHLHNRIPPELTVVAERRQLATVLRNLIRNAVKFTSSGGVVTVSGELQSENSNKTAAITVEDSGSGMDEATLERLFDPRNAFSRRGTAGETGHGLGLLICRDLSVAMGGALQADSTPGEGSRFTLTLPVPPE